MRNATADRQLQRLIGLAQVDPSILDNFDMDAYAQSSAYDQGVPTEYTVDPEQRDEMRQFRAQQAQAQQAMQMGNETMKSMGQQNVGKLMDEASMEMGEME
jgi:hypothetical protein